MSGLTYRGTFLSESNTGQRSASRDTQHCVNLTLSLAQEISEYSVQNGQVRLTTIRLKISEGQWWCHCHQDHRGCNLCSSQRQDLNRAFPHCRDVFQSNQPRQREMRSNSYSFWQNKSECGTFLKGSRAGCLRPCMFSGIFPASMCLRAYFQHLQGSSFRLNLNLIAS